VAPINTTAGPVDEADLGLTLIHEHMRVRSEAVAVQFPHLYDEATSTSPRSPRCARRWSAA
jgi:phosphotriesterase-related protein